MLWAALLPDAPPRPPPSDPAQRTEALGGIALWCLQFTPRVALLEAGCEPSAVVMELEASVRLFGGKRRLVERVRAESAALGVAQLSWAPTSLAALALARTGVSNGFAAPLAALLDALPVDALDAATAHRATLSRLGCRTLGQLRALPRGGVSRRFDATLLAALDQAYGLRPEAHCWVEIPDTFAVRLELMARVELAPALLFGARRLLLQLCGWLAARHAGVAAFTLRWWHDAMRSQAAGEGGELTVRTAQPTRDVEHLSRLLAEHLAHVVLSAPVGDLQLIALEVCPLAPPSLSLLPETRQAGEDLARVLERITARLGPERVLRPLSCEDHRPEWMTHWQPATATVVHTAAPARSGIDLLPQPAFVLSPPLRLALRDQRPVYQGPLQLLLGPHRVEGGWWDRTVLDGQPATRHVARDYLVALSEHAGALWVFQTRLDDAADAWFLHGTFA